MSDIIKQQIRQLEIDYYIHLAQIIEGYLVYDNADLEKWIESELPYWQTRIETTINELRQYQKHLEKRTTSGTRQLFNFDVKLGVRDFLEITYNSTESKINKIDVAVEAKASIGETIDKEEAREFLQKLIDLKDKLYKLQRYLNNFDENFEKDKHLLEKYLVFTADTGMEGI